jgi:MerC mercury resistance protein
MSIEQSASSPGKRMAFASADSLGVWASALCVVHCVLTPVLLSFSAVFAHFLSSDEKVHRSFAVSIAMIGGVALLSGYRKHRRLRIPVLMGIGLGFIFAGAWWGDRLPSHGAEVAVTMVGSGFMIIAHRMNHTFCRNCPCAQGR